MTWVIGTTTFFGYSFLISDICVSYNNKTKDCLQKIYPVGNYMIAGFSGSVELGFIMLQDLRNFLLVPEASSDESYYAWYPEWVAKHWQVNARNIYKNYYKKDRENLSIIISGVDPKKNLGGDLKIPKSVTAILKSKTNFHPEFSKINEVVSIGSGSNINKYKKFLKKLSEFFNPLLNLEVDSNAGFAHAIKIAITDLVKDNPAFGISNYLHIGIVKRGGYFISNNDHKIIQGDNTINFKMPKVAKSYKELKLLLSEDCIRIAIG